MSEPIEPSNSIIYGIATNTVETIAANILSGYTAQYVDPVFGALGIQSPNSSAYNSQVLGELQKIEGTLVNITTKLSELSSAVNQLSNAITTLSSELTDAELQDRLAKYVACRAIINQNYMAFLVAIESMSSTVSFSQGTQQLFELFGVINTVSVASNLQIICTLLCGDGELKGILDFQGDELQKTYLTLAQAVTPINQPTLPGSTNTGIQWSKPYIDGGVILNLYPQSVESAFETTILPTLKAAYACMLQGLHFLCAAWGGTNQAQNLKPLVDAINGVGAKTTSIFPNLDQDAIVAQVLEQACQYIDPISVSMSWWTYNGGYTNVLSPSFDTSFVLWTVTGGLPPNPNGVNLNGPYVAVVKEPWIFGQVVAYIIDDQPYLIDDDGTTVAPYYQSWTPPYSMNTDLGPLVIAKPSCVAPNAWIDFIARLPLANTVLSEDYGNSQYLGESPLTLNLSNFPSLNALSVCISVESSNEALADSWFYFKDGEGKQVLAAELKCGGGTATKTSTFNFDQPCEISSVDCYSWWAACTLKTLVVRYSSGFSVEPISIPDSTVYIAMPLKMGLILNQPTIQSAIVSKLSIRLFQVVSLPSAVEVVVYNRNVDIFTLVGISDVDIDFSNVAQQTVSLVSPITISPGQYVGIRNKGDQTIYLNWTDGPYHHVWWASGTSDSLGTTIILEQQGVPMTNCGWSLIFSAA